MPFADASFGTLLIFLMAPYLFEITCNLSLQLGVFLAIKTKLNIGEKKMYPAPAAVVVCRSTGSNK